MAMTWRASRTTAPEHRQWRALGRVLSFAFSAQTRHATEQAGAANTNANTNAHAGPAAASAGSAGRAEAGFDALFAQYEPQVFGYLWRITGDRNLASDLCQETFLRAWQRFDTLCEYEQPVGWLLRVATNLALNALRRRRTRVGVPVALDDMNAPEASDPAWRVAEHDVVHRTLLALPEKMRAALVLREVYGLSFVEVARALGISDAAAKMTLSRARERFRQRYTSEEGRA